MHSEKKKKLIKKFEFFVRKKFLNVFTRLFDVFFRFSKLSDVFGLIRIRSDLLGCVRTCWDATGAEGGSPGISDAGGGPE